MLALVSALRSRWLTPTRRRPRPGPRPRPSRRGEAGQAVAEYALVLLGAGAIALLLARWASSTTRIYDLLDAVIEQLVGKVL